MRARTIIALVLLAAAFAGGVLWMRHRAAARSSEATPRGGAAQDRPVPVTVGVVERRDVPIYLEGLGNVAAFYSVAVRSQVDGRLLEVTFREGQDVHRGDLLAQIDARPFRIQLLQAQAVLARDRAQLHANQRVLARDRVLRAGNLIAQQDLDTALAAVETAQASVRADEAQVANARLMLDYSRVTAPIDGVTGIRQVDPGNLVRASDATGIVSIAQVNPISVLFTLAQDELPRIAREMARGPLRVEVFSRDGRTQLGAGQLALVDNQVNANTATIRLKATVPNAERTLWPEQFVKVRMLLSVRRGALVLPASAIQRGPQGTFVYLVGADQRVTPRNVTSEQVEGELALVNEGLSGGESVVIDGQNLLRPGARVAPRGADGGGGRRGADGAGRAEGAPGGGRGHRADGDAGTEVRVLGGGSSNVVAGPPGTPDGSTASANGASSNGASGARSAAAGGTANGAAQTGGAGAGATGGVGLNDGATRATSATSATDASVPGTPTSGGPPANGTITGVASTGAVGSSALAPGATPSGSGARGATGATGVGGTGAGARPAGTSGVRATGTVGNSSNGAVVPGTSAGSAGPGTAGGTTIQPSAPAPARTSPGASSP